MVGDQKELWGPIHGLVAGDKENQFFMVLDSPGWFFIHHLIIY
jgi:hypothetical protein